MTAEKLWKIQTKRVGKNGTVSWRSLTQPKTRKTLVWTTEADAHNYAICYCGFQAGNARVVQA